VPGIINAILCLWDERQIRKAGYADGWLTFFGMFLAPVYLFLRARRLKTFPSYGIGWIASFLVAVVIAP
jgi:hypothetical protein